jgi:hypothetical protein
MVKKFLKVINSKILEFIEKKRNLFLMRSDRLKVYDNFLCAVGAAR